MTLFADFNSSVNVPFQRMRALLGEAGGGLQAGVIGSGDLKVVQRGAGANQSVDVAVGAAWVAITTGTRNGLGHVYSDAIANVTVTASNATNPRVDQIILRWNDSSIPTGSGNVPTLEVLTGTAAAGAQITNTAGANYRAGAAALPNDCLRLADILVPAASTSVTTANIVDRRPWARGAHRFLSGAGPATSNVVGATQFAGPRIECSGAPIRLTWAAQFSITVGVVTVTFSYGIDGVSAEGRAWSPGTTGVATPMTHVWEFTPTAGSHLVQAMWSVSSTGGTINASLWTLEWHEIPRQNAENT